jgi:hypothetical protein
MFQVEIIRDDTSEYVSQTFLSLSAAREFAKGKTRTLWFDQHGRLHIVYCRIYLAVVKFAHGRHLETIKPKDPLWAEA